MKLSEYIRDKWVSVGIAVITCLAAAVFLLFMETELPLIIAVETIFSVGYISLFLYECLRKKCYYDELEETWEALEEKAYLAEMIDPPDFLEGKLLYRLMRQNGKYLNDVIAAGRQEMMEYKEYIQTWAHEIKTPIAAQELLIENNRNPVTSSLEEETLKIEAYVEQMLYYARSGSLEADFIIQPVNLKKLIMDVIKKNKKLLVGAGISPRFGKLDYQILADPKWLEFILGQIVTNSVKYRDSERTPYIWFRTQEDGRMLILTVADNGIGIPPKDLSRVFKKGFTGENGRIFTKSTGMGLYLCKSLCDKMEIPIAVRSRHGEGTELILRLQYNKSVTLLSSECVETPPVKC